MCMFLEIDCLSIVFNTNNILTASNPLGSSCLVRVVIDPDTDDGDEADNDKDNVQAKQHTVIDPPDHLPFL